MLFRSFRARLVRLFLPHICCGRAPARMAARTRSRSHIMVLKCLYHLHIRRFSPACRANGLSCRTSPSAPPASPAASQPWLPARALLVPGWRPARRRALRCVPPSFRAGAQGAQGVARVAQWLQVRQEKPDWVTFWGAGSGMNSTAMTNAQIGRAHV